MLFLRVALISPVVSACVAKQERRKQDLEMGVADSHSQPSSPSHAQSHGQTHGQTRAQTQAEADARAQLLGLAPQAQQPAHAYTPAQTQSIMHSALSAAAATAASSHSPLPFVSPSDHGHTAQTAQWQQGVPSYMQGHVHMTEAEHTSASLQ